MRKALYSIGIFLFLCVLALGYYGSYRISDMKMKLSHMEKALNDKEIQEADRTERRITLETQCTIEEYDQHSGKLTDTTQVAADNFLGMDRQELLKFLKASETMYYQYSLVAFSPQHVVIRQVRTEYETYFLVEEKGKVVVYKGDRQTVYEPTEIRTSTLPEKLKKEIKDGKYLDSQEKLYNFLENYST